MEGVFSQEIDKHDGCQYINLNHSLHIDQSFPRASIHSMEFNGIDPSCLRTRKNVGRERLVFYNCRYLLELHLFGI